MSQALIQHVKSTLPSNLLTMKRKGNACVWLPQRHALRYERFCGYLNDRHFIMTDYDKPHDAAHELYDLEPNFVVYNPLKWTHQAFWLLANPVHCQPDARLRAPWQYLREIERSFDEKYGCDPRFARHIHRNPFHPIVTTDWRHKTAYKLTEAAEVVELNPLRALKAKNGSQRLPEGGSRNCELFDELRTWGYRNIILSRNSESYETWLKRVITRALALNVFESPLRQSEVIATAKSVAKFTWSRYQPKDSYELTDEFRAKQAARGALGGKISKRPKVTESLENTRPWEQLGISRSTFYRRKNQGLI
jgi:hypothetical protein